MFNRYAYEMGKRDGQLAREAAERAANPPPPPPFTVAEIQALLAQEPRA